MDPASQILTACTEERLTCMTNLRPGKPDTDSMQGRKTDMHGKVAFFLMVHFYWVVMRQRGDVVNASLPPYGSYSGMGIQQVHSCVALQAQHIIKHKPAHDESSITDNLCSKPGLLSAVSVDGHISANREASRGTD